MRATLIANKLTEIVYGIKKREGAISEKQEINGMKVMPEQ